MNRHRFQRSQKGKRLFVLLPFCLFVFSAVPAQSLLQRIDSMLTRNYRKGNIDTAYITRPQTKWTIVGRLNVSGAKIESEGTETESGRHFKSEMKADYKSTISVGVSYLGFSLNLSLNPAKLMGKYDDYELNFNSYGKRIGFDIIYQDAHNFTGWQERDGLGRADLPGDLLKLKTLNANVYYVFNNRRFSYPAAFTQSYIQRRSAGSLLMALSGQGQQGTVSGEQELEFKMTNIGIGAGYGYNYVPAQGWLLHISAMPTFIVYSHTSMTFNDTRVPLHYHFPEAIITGRGAVVRQKGNKFYGMSMVFNFTNIGNKESLAVHNIKWRVRAFFGLRL
ncbi:MAG: DUF4421 family protein [Prevotella sp.]|nr:DUF4421 family protein [Prevotella sp.]